MKDLSEIKSRLVSPKELFRAAAQELKKKIKIRDFYFLTPSLEGGVFVTEYSTRGGRPFFTAGELKVLSQAGEKEVIFPRKEFKEEKYLLIKKSLLNKLKLKIWLYRVCAIMPVYAEGTLACLVLFRAGPGQEQLEKKIVKLKKINLEIGAALSSVLLYNQALRGIIKAAEV